MAPAARASARARGPGTAPGPAGPRGHRSESRPPFWLRFTQPRLDECFAFDNSCSRHVCIGSSTSAELCSPKASWVMHTHSTVLPAIFVAAGHFRRRRRSHGMSQGVSLAFLQVREEVTRAPLVAAEHGACAAQILVRVRPVLLLAPTQECLVDEALLDETLDFLGLGRRR